MNVTKVIGNRFISTPGDWRTEAIPVSKVLCFKQGFSHIHFYYRHPKSKARGAQRFTAKNAREYYARKSILFFACLVSFTVGKCALSVASVSSCSIDYACVRSSFEQEATEETEVTCADQRSFAVDTDILSSPARSQCALSVASVSSCSIDCACVRSSFEQEITEKTEIACAD